MIRDPVHLIDAETNGRTDIFTRYQSTKRCRVFFDILIDSLDNGI